MKTLPRSDREQVLNLLVEGNSMQATARLVRCSFNTVKKLLVDAGEAAAEFHDRNVRMVRAKRIQCDEIWAFCYAKKKNVETAKNPPPFAGDIWTWTAIDPKSKLIVSYQIGDRTIETGEKFMKDLQSRLAYRVQLTTDGLGSYQESVDKAFGNFVDYSQLVKSFKYPTNTPDGKFTLPIEVTSEKSVIKGDPDPKHITTSHVERQNLTMRMGMRRFTRSTNGFSKKFQNHVHMCSLYFLYYNFIRPHMSLDGKTPAMKAGIFEWPYDIGWILDLIDYRAPKPDRPKTYRKMEKESV